MADIQETVAAWEGYLRTIDDWHKLIDGIEPKIGGCGLVYEIPNPIDRPNESFAIADMRELDVSEPHRHINGEVEIYTVLQGIGKIAVGTDIYELKPGVTIVTPPDTMHITIPTGNLVLAVVNTPPFNADNYIAMTENDPVVADALQKLAA
jgi:mannose-6-phosphate isomerase-like protein (cupin superfamily)